MTGIGGITPAALTNLLALIQESPPSSTASGGASPAGAALSFNFDVLSFSSAATNLAGLKPPLAFGDSEVLAAQAFAALDAASDKNKDSQIQSEAGRRAIELGLFAANLAAQKNLLDRLASAEASLAKATADLGVVKADLAAQTRTRDGAVKGSTDTQKDIDALNKTLSGIDPAKDPSGYKAVQVKIDAAAQLKADYDKTAAAAQKNIDRDQSKIGSLQSDIDGYKSTIADIQGQLAALVALFALLQRAAQTDISHDQVPVTADPVQHARDLNVKNQLDALLDNILEATRLLSSEDELKAIDETVEAVRDAQTDLTKPETSEDLKDSVQLAAGLLLGLATVEQLLRAQAPIPTADANAYGSTQSGRLNLVL